MQKRIDEIQKEITLLPARTAWDKGVRGYAEELFDDYIERLGISDNSLRIGKIKEADLLNGAENWKQYSWGGCAEIYDAKICARLSNKAEIRKAKNGTLPPNASEEWLDVQARALHQAAGLVIDTINRRNEKC